MLVVTMGLFLVAEKIGEPFDFWVHWEASCLLSLEVRFESSLGLLPLALELLSDLVCLEELLIVYIREIGQFSEINLIFEIFAIFSQILIFLFDLENLGWLEFLV